MARIRRAVGGGGEQARDVGADAPAVQARGPIPVRISAPINSSSSLVELQSGSYANVPSMTTEEACPCRVPAHGSDLKTKLRVKRLGYNVWTQIV